MSGRQIWHGAGGDWAYGRYGSTGQPVDVALESGDRLVVTGGNGTGKSTLLAVLAGLLEPTGGTVHRANARVQLLRQESARSLNRRARDVFTEHVTNSVTAGRLAESDVVGLTSLGLLPSRDANKRIGDLSMGQRRRLDLACALATRPHALLLDEPTNHLSIALVDELTEALQATEAAIVLATHDRQLRRDIAGRPTLELPDRVITRA